MILLVVVLLVDVAGGTQEFERKKGARVGRERREPPPPHSQPYTRCVYALLASGWRREAPAFRPRAAGRRASFQNTSACGCFACGHALVCRPSCRPPRRLACACTHSRRCISLATTHSAGVGVRKVGTRGSTGRSPKSGWEHTRRHLPLPSPPPSEGGLPASGAALLATNCEVSA